MAAYQVMQALTEGCNSDLFCTFPAVLGDLHGSDATFELSISTTLQPLRLFQDGRKPVINPNDDPVLEEVLKEKTLLKQQERTAREARIAEENRLAQERIAEQKRLAEEAAEKTRLEEELRIAREERIADEKREA